MPSAAVIQPCGQSIFPYRFSPVGKTCFRNLQIPRLRSSPQRLLFLGVRRCSNPSFNRRMCRIVPHGRWNTVSRRCAYRRTFSPQLPEPETRATKPHQARFQKEKRKTEMTPVAEVQTNSGLAVIDKTDGGGINSVYFPVVLVSDRLSRSCTRTSASIFN